MAAGGGGCCCCASAVAGPRARQRARADHDGADAGAQSAEGGVDVGPALLHGGGGGAALVVEHGVEGLDEVPRELVRRADVEEHRGVARELVGALKLRHRGVVVALFEEVDAPLVALPGLGDGGRRGRLLLLRERGGRAEGEAEGEGGSVQSHGKGCARSTRKGCCGRSSGDDDRAGALGSGSPRGRAWAQPAARCGSAPSEVRGGQGR